MSPKLSLWMLTAILTCGTLMTSCKHEMDDYVPPQPKPLPTNAERVAYAEKLFGVTIDKNQDWVLTNEYSVTVTADASLEGISRVAVIDGNPYAGASSVMASAAATSGSKTTLSFRAPTDSLLYAVCMNNDGKCIARPFIPGQVKTVGFGVEPGDYDYGEATTRAIDVIEYPTYKKFRIMDFVNFRKALYDNLPEGNNNTDKLSSDFGSRLLVMYNGFNFYELPLVFLGGIGKADFGSDSDNLGYRRTTSTGGEGHVTEFVLKDHFKNAFQPKYDSDTKSYSVEGMYLVARDSEGKITTQFAPTPRYAGQHGPCLGCTRHHHRQQAGRLRLPEMFVRAGCHVQGRRARYL